MKNQKIYFNDWLNNQMKNAEFKKAFKEEDVRARLALKIAEYGRKEKLRKLSWPDGCTRPNKPFPTLKLLSTPI